jgi:hypothetical protein
MIILLYDYIITNYKYISPYLLQITIMHIRIFFYMSAQEGDEIFELVTFTY